MIFIFKTFIAATYNPSGLKPIVFYNLLINRSFQLHFPPTSISKSIAKLHLHTFL